MKWYVQSWTINIHKHYMQIALQIALHKLHAAPLDSAMSQTSQTKIHDSSMTCSNILIILQPITLKHIETM